MGNYCCKKQNNVHPEGTYKSNKKKGPMTNSRRKSVDLRDLRGLKLITKDETSSINS